MVKARYLYKDYGVLVNSVRGKALLVDMEGYVTVCVPKTSNTVFRKLESGPAFLRLLALV